VNTFVSSMGVHGSFQGVEGMKNCILCGAPADYQAVFVPSKPWAFGDKNGNSAMPAIGKMKAVVAGQPPSSRRQRLIFYGLCEACAARPSYTEAVEKVLADTPPMTVEEAVKGEA